MSKPNLQNHQRESRLFSRRCYAIFAFIVFFILLILIRLVFLQVVEHKTYTDMSVHNMLRVIPIEPTRGLIYDRNGVLLAKNIPVFSLDIIPGEVPNLKNTINNLSKIISLQPNDLQLFQHALIEHRRYQPVPIKYKLSEKDLDSFYVNEYKFPGVIVQANMLRQYLLNNTLNDVIGYVARINATELEKSDPNAYRPSDYIGKTGIEKEYEETLRGQTGSALVEMDAAGQIVHKFKNIPPVGGKNLYLTIDSKLQAYAEKELGNNNGALVAIQPGTGQVLALVTKPTYNPNPFVMGISEKTYHGLMTDPNHPLYNRAIRGLYSPGSTIKPFHALNGLNSQVITPDYTIFDKGWYRVPHTKHTFHDDKWDGHGYVDLHKAIEVSCDTYFYNLSVKLGIKRIDQFLPAFGYGQPTNIDLPGELTGVLPSPDWKRSHKGLPWYTGDTVNTGIGQGMVLTTPVQLAYAASIIAEHGQRFTPHLTLKWQNTNGLFTNTVNTSIAPIALKNPNDWNTIISAMEDVVNHGTARLYGAHPGYKVAGKTGTAQVYGTYRDEETSDLQRPKRLRNNHLFINFAPVSNPKIVIAIVIEHASYADVIAGKITRFYLNELKEQKHA